MKGKEKQVLALLLAALFLLSGAAGLAASGVRQGPTEYYDTQVRAAQQLERCFEAVRGYKAERNIPLSQEDYHATGMIGEPYTGITTTLGAVEAKRTTAWPDMAALCVRLLYEAGVRPGDRVGGGFSGSFPGMDLALVAACESMDVELVCIASVGASTYGANNPELTFPEMLCLLERDGLIRTQSAAVTMGGNQDVGTDMEQETAAEIRSRLRALGLDLVEEPDYAANLAWRESLYRELGPIDCFVAVGGNVTSLGRGESGISLGQGVLRPQRQPRLDGDSGLVQRYLVQGLPVINLLNIKKLTADYGLPYDPVDWPPVGQSAVYYRQEYPKVWLALGLAGGAASLLVCGCIRYRPSWDNERRKEREQHGGNGIENLDH